MKVPTHIVKAPKHKGNTGPIDQSGVLNIYEMASKYTLKEEMLLYSNNNIIFIVRYNSNIKL